MKLCLPAELRIIVTCTLLFLFTAIDEYLKCLKHFDIQAYMYLTVSKSPGNSNFVVFNHLYLCFSYMKLAETLNCV